MVGDADRAQIRADEIERVAGGLIVQFSGRWSKKFVFFKIDELSKLEGRGGHLCVHIPSALGLLFPSIACSGLVIRRLMILWGNKIKMSNCKHDLPEKLLGDLGSSSSPHHLEIGKYI